MTQVISKKSLICAADVLDIISDFKAKGGDIHKDLIHIQVLDAIDPSKAFNVGGDIVLLNNGRLLLSIGHPEMVVYSKDQAVDNTPPGCIRIPKSLEEAKGMHLIAEKYIKDHTPDND